MKCENIKSLECKLVGKEYKFYYFDNSDPLENMVVVKPKFDCIDNSEQTYFFLDDYAFENVYIDEQGVLCYVNRFCKHCESRNVIRKDFNTRRVFNSKGKLIILKLKRYLCKDCGRKSQTELSYAFRPYARIPNQVIDDCSLSLHNGDKTVRQQSKDIELFKKIPISHETVRKALFTNNKDCYKKYDFDVSGYCAYDAQWIPQGGKFIYRLVLIDIEEYLPIAEAIVEKEDENSIFDFINKSIPRNKRKGIVTDSQKNYDKIMKKLGFKYHQDCIFHLLKRINDLINNETNKFKKEYKKELENSNSQYSESKIKDLANEAAKKYRKKLAVYHDEFKQIFEQENYKDAINLINKIRGNISEYPSFLAEYLINNFFPVYKRFIVFLEKDVKGHLEKTNNKCENYIGKILKKSRKSDFKTKYGVFDYICHKVDGWFERRLKKSNN